MNVDYVLYLHLILSLSLTHDVLVVWIYRWPSRHSELRTHPSFPVCMCTLLKHPCSSCVHSPGHCKTFLVWQESVSTEFSVPLSKHLSVDHPRCGPIIIGWAEGLDVYSKTTILLLDAQIKIIRQTDCLIQGYGMDVDWEALHRLVIIWFHCQICRALFGHTNIRRGASGTVGPVSEYVYWPLYLL